VGITVGFACALGALGAIGAAIFTESVAWLLAAVSLGGIAAGAFYGHHEIESKIDDLNLQV
jgi:arginine exporter protein ArgO